MTETGNPSAGSTDHAGWSASNLFANRPFVVSVLFLASYFFVFTAVVGVVLAHVFRAGQAEEWERSLFIYLIRTFWLLIGTLAICLVGGIVLGAMTESIVGIVPFVLLAGAALLQSAARTIYAMLNSVRQTPMQRPRTWLV